MHVLCPRCEHRVEPTGRSMLWRVALAGLAGFFVAMVLGASLIGPFILMAVPLMMLVGFAFGPLSSICTEDPSCPKCALSLAPRHLRRAVERSRARASMAERAER